MKQGTVYYGRYNSYGDLHEIYFPDMEECASAGHTYEEALKEGRRHLGWSIVERLRKKQPVPEPSSKEAATIKADEMQAQIAKDCPEYKVVSCAMIGVEVDLTPWYVASC